MALSSRRVIGLPWMQIVFVSILVSVAGHLDFDCSFTVFLIIQGIRVWVYRGMLYIATLKRFLETLVVIKYNTIGYGD